MSLPHPLLSQSAFVPLYLMLRHLADVSKAPPLLDAHLAWMIEMERRGVIVLSGPIEAPSAAEGELVAVSVLRARDLAAAREIAEDDPFVRHGYVRFSLHEWTACEGSIRLSMKLSDGSATFE